jgi:hypothetical protein
MKNKHKTSRKLNRQHKKALRLVRKRSLKDKERDRSARFRRKTRGRERNSCLRRKKSSS